MQLDDLPLFASSTPATIIVFPLERRIGKVRRTAQLLSERHSDDAALYWKQVNANNLRHLTRLGLAPAEIEAELQSFFDAVQAELNRITCGARSPAGAS
jgi:hypothetical protein